MKDSHRLQQIIEQKDKEIAELKAQAKSLAGKPIEGPDEKPKKAAKKGK